MRRGDLRSPETAKRPVRKPNRLQGYDYSREGAYFITACARNREELFGHIVEETTDHQFTELSELGRMVMDEINTLSNAYPMVYVDRYVIMPNHVHMIIVTGDGQPQVLTEGDGPEYAAIPSVSRIIKQWKGAITKRIGFSPWQKSFHDHLIRSQDDYLRIAQYIETNPTEWTLDSLHPARCEGTP